jgi:hypothetical protein
MKKYYLIYPLVVAAAFVLGFVMQIIFIRNDFVSNTASTQHAAYQSQITPTTLAFFAIAGCLIHLFLVAKKAPAAKKLPTSPYIQTVLVSSAITFLVATVGFFMLVSHASQQIPEIGLFVFMLPIIGLIAALVGALIGMLIVVIKKVVQAR